jgi:hypothetical protein
MTAQKKKKWIGSTESIITANKRTSFERVHIQSRVAETKFIDTIKSWNVSLD